MPGDRPGPARQSASPGTAGCGSTACGSCCHPRLAGCVSAAISRWIERVPAAESLAQSGREVGDMASEKGLSSAAQSLHRALSILGATLSPRRPRSCCANAATAPFVLQVMRWTVTPGAKRPHELDTRRAAQAEPQLRSRCHWQCWCFASAACKARCHPPTASCPRKRLLQVF